MVFPPFLRVLVKLGTALRTFVSDDSTLEKFKKKKIEAKLEDLIFVKFDLIMSKYLICLRYNDSNNFTCNLLSI